MSGATFTWPIRVYWEDTDGGGVVYYANYLKFMERARTELLRSLGVNQGALAAEQGLIFTIVSTDVRYLRPARLDDLLVVTCTVLEQTRVSFAFDQQIRRDGAEGELLTQATTRAACLDRNSFKPRRLPESMTKALELYRA